MLTFPTLKPNALAPDVLWYTLAQLPWYAIKTYPPIFLIASSAAYASSQFAQHQMVFPPMLAWAQAIAFEWVYLGAIALASNNRSVWFYVTVLSGALTSMLYIFLHSANQYHVFDTLTTEQLHTMRIVFAVFHAVPLTVIGVSYMLLFHIAAREQHEALHKVFTCPTCEKPFKSQQAVYAHKQFCK